MSDAADDMCQLALFLEHEALIFPRKLAALALVIAAARIVGDAPDDEREVIREFAMRGLLDTLAEHERRRHD